MNKEQKFYNALEDIFVGAKIEGDSGFINLLKIKEKYYSEILAQFKREVDKCPEIEGDFKEEFFDKLYTFFNKYFSESGSVYFTKTANWQRVYEKVYTDNRDVVLFWKTHMLYYVKTDILFNSMDVNIEDDEKEKNYNFYFDVGGLQSRQNNEKRKIIYEFREVENKNYKDGSGNAKSKEVYIFDVMYSERGRITKIDKIVKETEIPDTILMKAFKTFEKQSEVDFFINKNARVFLTEQLDLYLHQILLEDDNKFHQKRLNQIKIIKLFAIKIIDFISQFEDELVRIWNKPKFVLNSNYVISLDKISKHILDKIWRHPNLIGQIEEWGELGMIDDEFDFSKDVECHKYLPVDTKYFKDLEIEILDQFENIDDSLDGRLIHSENYQALNTLQDKYNSKIQCIYIDPPFNTGKDFEYIDRYQDSSWLSIMNDRLNLAYKLLKDDGCLWLHLDENANNYGKELIKDKFDDINEIIFDTNATKDEEADLFGYKSFGDNFQLKHQTIYYARNLNKYKFNKLWKPNRNTTKLDIGWLDLIAEPIVEKPKKISDYKYYIKIWENGEMVKKFINVENEKIFPIGDIWNDIFSFMQSEMRVSESFSFTSSQKPENLLRRIVQSSTDEGDLILDFFLGIGTTTAVAHKLGRKWIGVEMGNHFNEWYYDGSDKKLGILGRMKWVLYNDQKIHSLNRRPHLSKDIDWQGGGFFKYYSLEQYEDTLRNMRYKDNQTTIFNDRNPFEEYIFFADNKLADVLEIEKENIKLNFNKLYENIDWPETISNLLGLPIKKIYEKSFILGNSEEEMEINIDFENMSDKEKLEFIQLIKPLLWWGE
ncbi:MAG: site-specific DNA-methyltransferase [Tissierellia bacterium]|nr:site-specific DNA-methyltransferase [Tissierellia bacterium]